MNLGGTLELHYSFMRAHFDEAAIVRLDQQLVDGAVQPGARCGKGNLSRSIARPGRLWPWPTRRSHGRTACWCTNASRPRPRRRPQAPAILFGDQVLDFASLERQANQLAHRLVAEGVGARSVRRGLARGPQVIVALLAVLKAGGAYVPLDASYPAERLAYLMRTLVSPCCSATRPCAGSCRCRRRWLPLSRPARPGRTADPCAANVVQPQSLALCDLHLRFHRQAQGCASSTARWRYCETIGRRYAMVEDDCELHFMSFAFDGARALAHRVDPAAACWWDDSLWGQARPARACVSTA